jgi:Zn ribbon nucleic-acid-binding protein
MDMSDGMGMAVAANHRFSIPVACPVCEAAGDIKVTEEAGPPFTDTPRRAYTADPMKFTLLIGDEPPMVQCVPCGARFPRPPRGSR